jgi:hypothetical protein
VGFVALVLLYKYVMGTYYGLITYWREDRCDVCFAYKTEKHLGQDLGPWTEHKQTTTTTTTTTYSNGYQKKEDKKSVKEWQTRNRYNYFTCNCCGAKWTRTELEKTFLGWDGDVYTPEDIQSEDNAFTQPDTFGILSPNVVGKALGRRDGNGCFFRQ